MRNRPVCLSESVTIAQPPQVVWDVIADYGSDVQWRAGLVEMIPEPAGPPRNGTLVHEVLRTGGRTYVTDTSVSDVVDGSSYRFAGSGTSGDVQGSRTVLPAQDRTSSVFTYEIVLGLRGAARLIRPVVAKVMGASLRRDLDTLRGKVESGELG